MRYMSDLSLLIIIAASDLLKTVRVLLSYLQTDLKQLKKITAIRTRPGHVEVL